MMKPQYESFPTIFRSIFAILNSSGPLCSPFQLKFIFVPPQMRESVMLDNNKTEVTSAQWLCIIPSLSLSLNIRKLRFKSGCKG